jgi:DNA-binding beta-propeller fold protein YncE
VTNYSGGTVSVCAVNGDGTFGSCNQAGSGFRNPVGIALNAVGTQAYVANLNNSTVSVCAVNATTGQFSSCSNPTGSGFNTPYGITLFPH